MRLIKAAAAHDRVFVGWRAGGAGPGRRRRRRGGRRRRCGSDRGLSRLGRLRRRRATLLVGDVVLIAGLTRPWRNVGRLAAGPVRPEIGRDAGDRATRPKSGSEAKHEQDQAEPLDYHDTHFGTHSAPTGTRSVVACSTFSCAAFVAGL